MIRIQIRSNLEKFDNIVDENTTVRRAFEEQGIDFSRGTISIDGATLGAGEINKTFADLGYDGTPGNDRCYVACITKQDNANI